MLESVVAAATRTTLSALLRRSARLYGARTAVAWVDGSRTYAELLERVNRLANALNAIGVQRGERIAVLMENRPEYVELYYAAARLGVAVVALNPRWHREDIVHCLNDSAPRVLFTSPTVEAVVASVAGRVDGAMLRVELLSPAETTSAYERLILSAEAHEPDCEPAAEDISAILYTSGTTGRSKGAMISQRANAVRALRLAHTFSLTSDDAFLAWPPLCHVASEEALHATLLSGGKFVTMPRMDFERMFQLIERERVSFTALLPPVLRGVLHHPERRRWNLSSLRLAYGYANLESAEVMEELCIELGIQHMGLFGQTETSMNLLCSVQNPGEPRNLHLKDQPLLDIRVVDDDGRNVPQGRPGNFIVRGPTLMSGYLNNPEATAETFRDGWLWTGDLLVENDDGTYSFVDRAKYLIKTGGENVYPMEVEAHLMAHSAVADAVLVGVPDDHWGEAVKAFVVVRPGKSVDAAELVDWLSQRVASYKRPRYVEFIGAEDIPRSATGKIQRHDLKRRPVGPDQAVSAR